ncbi:MAG: hypothetical protein AAF676_04985 [Pseudomonadota bacterium]
MTLASRARALTLAAFASTPAAVQALPISIDADGNAFEVFHFRDVRTPNSVGFSSSPTGRLSFGAVDVVPNGKGGTTAIARQNGVEVELVDISTTINPNQMANGVDYDPALTGAWTLTFRNEDDVLVVETPAPGDAPPSAFATDVRQTASGVRPSFAWTPAPDVDRVTVNIYDLQNRGADTGLADRIFIAGVDPAASSFTMPDGVLEPDRLYSFSVQSQLTYEGGTNPSGSSQAGASRSVSRAFFDFTTGDLPNGEDVFLPIVDPNAPGGPVFNFDNAVLAGQLAFYDPLVAIGYDYAIGDGDPLFESVLLPEIGDGLFELWLDDGAGFALDRILAAGERFTFLDPVERFRILGIELSAALDPLDATAFVTGLSFVQDGRFTGTMRPITAEASEAAIPLPGAFGLLAAATGGLAALQRRRDQRRA